MEPEAVAEAQRLIRAIRWFRLAMSALVSRRMAKHGVNLPQCTVLALLGETEQMTMSALSEAIGTTMGAATNLVDRLVHAGHVKRERSRKDRRVVNVGVTPEGRQVLRSVWAEGEVYFSRFLGEIPEEDRRTFFRVYERLAERMREDLLKPEDLPKTEARDA